MRLGYADTSKNARQAGSLIVPAYLFPLPLPRPLREHTFKPFGCAVHGKQ